MGLAVARGGKLRYVTSLKLDKVKGKPEKRRIVRRHVLHLIVKYNIDVIVVERVRTFVGKTKPGKSWAGISVPTIVALGALVATIVDTVHMHNRRSGKEPIRVVSVDTRSWKSKVVGKPGASKEETVKYVAKYLWEDELDHDAADAACIAVSYWKTGITLKPEDL